MTDPRPKTDATIGTQLQSLRTFAALTVDEAAKKLSIDPVELSAYEAGVARPTPKMILALADCYGVPASRVFDTISASQRS